MNVNVLNYYDTAKRVIAVIRPKRTAEKHIVWNESTRKYEWKSLLYISTRVYKKCLKSRVISGTAGIYTDCAEDIYITDDPNHIDYCFYI